MNKSRVLVIIPAYNEEKTVSEVIRGVQHHALSSSVLVVNDGSTDNTVRVAKKAGAKVISHPFNLGYGAALQTGYKYASQHSYDYVVQVDADGQHEPRYINDLLDVLKSNLADMVVGSRFLENHGYKSSWIRKVGMSILRIIILLVTKRRITDCSSGFRALGQELVNFFANINYPSDYDDADIIVLTYLAGFRIKEVAVTMRESTTGKSMHRYNKLIYYGFKTLLSLMVTLLRKKPQR